MAAALRVWSMQSALSNIVTSCLSPGAGDSQGQPPINTSAGPMPMAATVPTGNGAALSPKTSTELFGQYAPDPVSPGNPGQQAVTPQDVEKMVTLYHVSSSKAWADAITKGNASKTPLKDLKNPIDPDYSKNKRKQGPCDDGRGGDDLGPGFYTGNSPEFVDYYTKNDSVTGDSSVMKFELPEKALAALKRKDIAPDDDVGFKQSMRNGFNTVDTRTGQLSPPKLDQGVPANDLTTGPINDVEAVKNMGVQTDGTTQYSPGSILKLGNQTPLQFAFATQKGVETLYSSANITNYSLKDWRAMREKEQQQKQGQP